MREKQPGVWEVRVCTGTDARGKPTQISRTVHGTERHAERLAAASEVGFRTPTLPISVGSKHAGYRSRPSEALVDVIGAMNCRARVTRE